MISFGSVDEILQVSSNIEAPITSCPPLMTDEEMTASEVVKIKNMKVINTFFLAKSSGVKFVITLGHLQVRGNK